MLVIGAAIWLYRRHTQSSPAQRPASRRPASGRETTMVRCDACGVFVPESETRRDGEHRICQRHV